MLIRVTVCLLFCAAFCSSQYQRPDLQRPRISATFRDSAFRTFSIPPPPAPPAGSPSAPAPVQLLFVKQKLYMATTSKIFAFSPQSGLTEVQQIVICTATNKDKCVDTITVFKEGKPDQFLICGYKIGSDTVVCYDVKEDINKVLTPTEITIVEAKPTKKDTAVYSGNDFYYTVSNEVDGSNAGLYKAGKVKPPPQSKVQWYLKIIPQSASRIFTFSMEKSDSLDLLLPMLSVYCTTDPGSNGQWITKMKAPLTCGSLNEKKFTVSELLDVAAWENEADFYALFRISSTQRAVCYIKPSIVTKAGVAAMCSATETELRDLTVQVNWTPLLMSNYSYSHLVVDKMGGNTVLSLTLETGPVHKVYVEEKKLPFFITEYKPFKDKPPTFDTMVLDQTTKIVYAGSNSSLVEINLSACGMYNNTCRDCVMARDPYCAWNKTSCSKALGQTASLQDVKDGNFEPICVKESIPDTSTKPLDVLKGSPTFIRCPTRLPHASYSWVINGSSTSPLACLYTEYDCIYFIHNMSIKYEGEYVCVATEKQYTRNITKYRLQMVTSSSSYLSVQPMLLIGFLMILIC